MSLFLPSFLRPKPVAAHLVTGRRGEKIAERYLKSLGYRIRDRNVRVRRDEIDLIAFDPVDRVLVFVEVKTRSAYSEDFLPSANAGRRKWRKIRRGIARWNVQNNYDGPYRLDLISVAEGRVIDHAIELGEWQ